MLSLIRPFHSIISRNCFDFAYHNEHSSKYHNTKSKQFLLSRILSEINELLLSFHFQFSTHTRHVPEDQMFDSFYPTHLSKSMYRLHYKH